MILPPPMTSDCTLDDVEEYLDRKNRERDWARLVRQLRVGLEQAKSGGTETGAPSAGDEEAGRNAGEQE